MLISTRNWGSPAATAVSTVAKGFAVRAEWLVMQREADGDVAHTLLNVPANIPEDLLIG